MPSKCCVCSSNSRNTNISFFSFPREPIRRNAWIKSLGRDPEKWAPFRNDKVCEVHFKASDYEDRTSKMKRLNGTAIPSIFCQELICLPGCQVETPAPGVVLVSTSNSDYHEPSCGVSVAENFCLHLPRPRRIPLLEKNYMNLHNVKVNLQNSVQQLEKKVLQARKLVEKREKHIAALQETSDHNLMLLDSVLEADQSKVLEAGGKSQGRKWGMKSVEKALKVQLHGGPSTLKVVNEVVAPLPGVRTVQRRLAPIKFKPGVLHEILGPFKERVEASFSEADRDCALHFDEMALKEQRCFDTGLNQFIGDVTLEGGTGLACKMEVWTFAGLQRKWKVNAAYHFTPPESLSLPRAKVALQLLKFSEEAKMNCVALCCDMGNRGLLTELGYDFTKDKMKFSIVHPYNKNKRLRIVPDVVHLLKSVKEMLQNNEEIDIGPEIQKRFNLPTPIIKFQHIELLVDYQVDMDVEFHARLSDKDLGKSHFSKMNASAACHVFSDKTSAALEFLVEEEVFQEECKTTAWFVSLINKWFSIVSSRSLIHALSHKNKDAFDKAISVLNLTIEVFSSMNVGNCWKPVQTHVIIATRALLDLQEELLQGRNYDFIFLGRFANDIQENVMSKVRRGRPTPTCLEARYTLRQNTISQCAFKVVKSQYGHDDRENLLSLEHILDFIERKKKEEGPRKISLKTLHWHIPPEIGLGYKFQGMVDYRMSGYLLHSMRKSGQIQCDSCFQKLQHKGPPLFLARWTKKTNFVEGAQIEVCGQLYKLFHDINFNIKKWQPSLLKGENVSQVVWKSIDPVLHKYTLPSCEHCPHLKKKILKRFLNMKLKLLPRKSGPKEASGSCAASKSMMARALVSRYVTNTKNTAQNTKPTAKKTSIQSEKKKCASEIKNQKKTVATKAVKKSAESKVQSSVTNYLNQTSPRRTRSSVTMNRLKRLP